MAKERAHVKIYGMVQGVFFRAYTQEKANSLGLTGWVRNQWDGTVEAVFEGDKTKIENMVKWCYAGAPSARVEKVDVEWEEYTGKYTTFSVAMRY